MRPIQQRGLALASFLFSLALAVAAFTNHPVQQQVFAQLPGAVWGIAGFFAAVAALLLLTSFDRRSQNAWVRLDWFLPALRRRKTGDAVSHSLFARVFRKLIPAGFQSNHSTKKRGPIRRLLRRVGLSWLASPVRRIVQTICLITFLVLFFYTCWPYDARPIAEGRTSDGWALVNMDESSGQFQFELPDDSVNRSDEFEIAVGQTVYLADNFSLESGVQLNQIPIGTFHVSSSKSGQVAGSFLGELDPVLQDSIVYSNSGGGSITIFERDPTAWPSHYADNLARKEWIPAETFLIIDPLVSISTAVAARSWVWSLACAAIILFVCVLIPRGFCGYLCPLGTTIDLFDWALGGRTKRFRVPDDGWWVHIKYYLLAGTLVAAACGVLVSGFVAAIPVITRGMLFLVDPLQTGTMRGWHLIPSFHLGHLVSIALFLCVLGLGFLRPRFWCKYVCPSGAVFSLGNLFRVTERKVESSCINCNKCVEICPFDAIKPDFTTRTTDCTMCQSCGGVCPTHAIKFVERWNVVELKVEDEPPTQETPLGRRGFLSLAAGSTAAAVGGLTAAVASKSWGADLSNPNAFRPVRPPGSVPEQEFLEMCIRCGECFKACPNDVLQPEGFQQGLEGLWTPMVAADWAGCESSCNACGQVCPTGAIRALPIEEKRVARMGLAIVNDATCLPAAGREECDLCVQECNAAGYHAIEYTQVGVELDEAGQPIEGTGFAAPLVMADKCVGCGLCQTRCYAINVKDKHLLAESAIIVEAGQGREDRLLNGSYLELRKEEQAAASSKAKGNAGDFFIPEPPSTPPESNSNPEADDDPFGVNAASPF